MCSSRLRHLLYLIATFLTSRLSVHEIHQAEDASIRFPKKVEQHRVDDRTALPRIPYLNRIARAESKLKTAHVCSDAIPFAPPPTPHTSHTSQSLPLPS